ncbi:hypothetical protein [Streptomyces antimycoticus]
MPAYLIQHRGGQRGDMLISDDNLAVHITNGWIVFTDDDGPEAVVLALPAGQVASIQRIDPDTDGQEQDDATAKGPAPQE